MRSKEQGSPSATDRCAPLNDETEGAPDLTTAYGITDDGWISGIGNYTPTGGGASYKQTFLIDVDLSAYAATPEPTSLVLLALAGLPMVSRRRRR